MARGDEITTKFKIDINDLKKGITEANNQIKLANAQFKAATSGMDDWAKSADGIKAKLSQLDSVLNAQKSKLATYNEQLQRQEDAYNENGRRVEELKAKLQELANNGVAKTSEEYKKYENALAACEKEQDANKNAIDALKVTILNQEAAIGKTEKEIRNYNGSLDALGDSEQDAAKAGDGLDDALQKTGKAADDASDGFTVMKGALADLISAGIQKAIEGLKNLASATYDAWRSYDEGADNIIAATGATGDAADELVAVYENVAKSVVGDFGDIGTAIGEINTKFGLTGDELEKTAEKFIKFADINDTDVRTAIDNTQAAMTAFGLGTEETSNMLDILNKAGQDTGISVDALASALVSNAPALQEMGFNAAEAAKFVSQLEKSGVDTSQVMGGLKKALVNAAKEGKPMSEAMSEIEDSIKNASTETEAITTATELFGAKAGPAIAAAVRDGRISFDDFSAALDEFAGNVDTTYEAMLDGPDDVAVAMQNLKIEAGKVFETFLTEHGPQIKELVTNFTENVLPKLTEILGNVLEGISNIANNEGALKAITTGIGALIAAFAVNKVLDFATGINNALLAMRGLDAVTKSATISTIAHKTAQIATTAATKAVTAAQWLWNAALSANPIGLVVVAIAGLIAGITALVHHLNSEEKAIKSVQQAQEDLAAAQETAAEAEDTYINAVDRATAAEQALLQAQEEAGMSGADLYAQVQSGATSYDQMTEAQRNLYKAYTESLDATSEAAEATKALSDAKKAETIASFENDLAVAKETDTYDQYKTAVISAFENGTLSAEEARDLLGAAMSEMSHSAQQTYMEDIPTAIKDGLEPSQYETTGQKLGKWFEDRWIDIKNIWKEAPGWFSDQFNMSMNNIRTAFSTVKNWASEKWGEITDTFSGIGTWFGEKFQGAWTAITEKFSGWGAYWSGLWTNISNTFSTIGTKISNAISSSVKSGINGVISRIESVINSGIGLINGAIGLINNIPGVNIGTIGRVSFPRLAQGGVLKRGQIGFLEGSGAEAVVPLERNKQWIAAVANDILQELQTGAAAAGVNSLSNNSAYNFTQVINAPKAPSRIELYRQTRNLLAFAQGAR